MTGRQVIAALQRLGFEKVRQKGNHVTLRHPTTLLNSCDMPFDSAYWRSRKRGDRRCHRLSQAWTHTWKRPQDGRNFTVVSSTRSVISSSPNCVLVMRCT
ncbi:MAG: type II toxin-antitoxin system HicA family toxin [Armatimonadota bacterium]